MSCVIDEEFFKNYKWIPWDAYNREGWSEEEKLLAQRFFAFTADEADSLKAIFRDAIIAAKKDKT